MFIVVAYDISDDRRRARLHKRLKGFGRPVQYSVFECVVTEQSLRKLKEAVLQTIKRDEDLVRYYSLCQSCCAKIEAINGVVTEAIGTVVV
jgi:CRISPR-associated protein Cas2